MINNFIQEFYIIFTLYNRKNIIIEMQNETCET